MVVWHDQINSVLEFDCPNHLHFTFSQLPALHFCRKLIYVRSDHFFVHQHPISIESLPLARTNIFLAGVRPVGFIAKRFTYTTLCHQITIIMIVYSCCGWSSSSSLYASPLTPIPSIHFVCIFVFPDKRPSHKKTLNRVEEQQKNKNNYLYRKW